MSKSELRTSPFLEQSDEDKEEKTCSELSDGNRTRSSKSDLPVLLVNENKVLDNREEDVELDKKCEGSGSEEEVVPPALPPRPPPRPRQATPCNCVCECRVDDGEVQQRYTRRPPRSCWASGLRKYVFLCTACGSLSIMLGALFLTVYFMLKSYTSSLNYFETIPTYIPSGMLIATGFLITCLACRKNRNSFLMKLCGGCSLCCAVLCVTVTVTTTVIHMNRLQTLRECLYTSKTHSCTCYSVTMENDRPLDEGVKFVFNSITDCETIHGPLYSCLRAIFGLSVIGILICIFSCMLVYQLLSHEKKKMYWAQLEMRCRYLYRQQRNPHYCSCCDECRYPPPPHEIFPWELMGNRFWSTGRIGNLYTPNPEDRGNHNRLRSGWNWRRLPWSRGGTGATEPARTNLGSPDSQYGFSSAPAVEGAPYTVIDPRAPSVMSGCHSMIPTGDDVTEGGFYSWGPPPPYASNRNSANNSPARRSLGDILHQVSPIRRNDNVSPARSYHHVHHHHLHHTHSINHQCPTAPRQVPPVTSQSQPASLQKSLPLRSTPLTSVIQQQQQQQEQHQPSGMDAVRSNSLSSVHRFQKVVQNKDNYENTYESENPDRGFNTLPSLKKRNQPRASDVFHNETTGYCFSSAENVVCSEPSTESLPPRVYLTNDKPRPPKPEPEPENPMAKRLFANASPGKQIPRKKPSKNVEEENYRMGIPRSPNIHNLNQFLDKSNEWEDEEALNTSDESHQLEKHKVLKGLKLMSKDADLLQKHSSLIREFHKNLKFINEKNGIENEGFLEEAGKSRFQRQDYDGTKHNENESDVYFGDISNSSCYNDGRDSSLYEEANFPPQSLLNKQNLKLIENETESHEVESCEELESFNQNCRHRHSRSSSDSKSHETKTHRRSFAFSSHYNPRTFQDHFRPITEHYRTNSNDEQSSSSLTADSGISSGRSFIPRGFENAYQEINSESKSETSKLGEFSHPHFQKPKVVPRRYPKNEEISNQLLNTCNLNLNQEGDRPVVEEANLPKPKPTPRTSVGKSYAKYGTNKDRLVNHFLAPDAQYEYPNPKAKNGLDNPGKSKPVVPARPLNLQNVSQHRSRVKIDNMNIQMMRQNVGPVPRRRQCVGLDDSYASDEHKDAIEIGSHSVNV